MAKVLTVKYDRAFPLEHNMRGGFSVTLSLDAAETAESAMKTARQFVNGARRSAEAERKAGIESPAPSPARPGSEAAA